MLIPSWYPSVDIIGCRSLYGAADNHFRVAFLALVLQKDFLKFAPGFTVSDSYTKGRVVKCRLLNLMNTLMTVE